MKLIKKTDEYSIFQRGDERYAVKDAAKKAVNGDEKAAVLLAEGLIKVSQPGTPEKAEPATDEPAVDESAEDAAEPAAGNADAEEGEAE
ncbi:MAG: hypothetical protein AB8B57_06795 [Congregibacter sp.]